MSRFYGSVNGNARTQATRRGTPASGVTSTARGWDVGGLVEARADGDADVIEVYATHGSNAEGSNVHVATIRKNAAGDLEIRHRV